jgi:hypothetical protein
MEKKSCAEILRDGTGGDDKRVNRDYRITER